MKNIEKHRFLPPNDVHQSPIRVALGGAMRIPIKPAVSSARNLASGSAMRLRRVRGCHTMRCVAAWQVSGSLLTEKCGQANDGNDRPAEGDRLTGFGVDLTLE